MPYESELLIAKLEQNLKRYFRGRGDYHQALEYLTQLGRLRGPVIDSGAEEGMQELVRAGRASLVCSLVTKTGGTFWYRIASQALEQSGDADAVRALRQLARDGRSNERRYALDALTRLGKHTSLAPLWIFMLALSGCVLVASTWWLYSQPCTAEGFLGLHRCPTVTEPWVVVTNTGGQDVFLRKSTNLADRLTPCSEGVQLKVVGPDTEKDGVRWRQVEDTAGQRGWVLASNVVNLPTATPSPSPVPAESPTSLRCLPVPEWAYEGKWFANHRLTQMWNGPRAQTDAISFSDTSEKNCVFQERDRQGNRLYVFNSYTENYFWIDEFVVSEISMPETRSRRTRPPDRNCSDAIYVD